jgi:hypothetical protein
MRHTRATELLNGGVPIHVVQRYLGHLSPEMTMRYAETLPKTHEREFLRFKKLGADGRELALDPADIYEIVQLSRHTPAALGQVGEHRDVVVPPPRAGLIDPDPLDAFEVLRVDRPVDVVMHDPPDSHVRLTDEAARVATGISRTIAITNASNNDVNPDRGGAHGTATSRTLCSGHSTRGTRAARYA